MSEAVEKQRVQYRNIRITQIVRYRMPLSAIVSIMHRISGAFLFLMLPFLLYLFQQSILSETSFEGFGSLVSHWFAKLVLAGICWAYLHHFCAGIRHLLMDMHMGLDRAGSRNSSLAVFAVSLPLAILVALKLFGAF